MNVFLLMVALASPVGANAGWDEEEAEPTACPAASADVRTVRTVSAAAAAESPEALVPGGKSVEAAEARTQALPKSSAAQSAKSGDCRIGEAHPTEDAGVAGAAVAASAVGPASAAEAHERAFGEARPASHLVASPPAVLRDARPADGSEPDAVGTLPPAKPKSGCDIVGTFARERFLSGPWSASRRLEAARIRGDEEEARRMEALLDDLLGKAILQDEK